VRTLNLIENKKKPIYKLSYLVEIHPLNCIILNFGNFLCHDHWVVISDLLLPHGIVVKRAVVLVTVSVDGTEEVATPAGKSC